MMVISMPMSQENTLRIFLKTEKKKLQKKSTRHIINTNSFNYDDFTKLIIVFLRNIYRG